MEETSIAIIGMAGRFPGAKDVSEFWANLCAGKESVCTFSDEELRAAGIPESAFRDEKYVRRRATLDRPEWFDAAFFGFTPREAELTDPQHRVFLECAWTALEDAALDPERYSGTIGVWAGSSLNTYLLDNIGSHREQVAEFVQQFQADGYPLLIGNDKDYVATRVAYKFNLRGPAMSVQTACSTSLVAVVQAVNALLGFQCDTALAGGVSISFPQERGYVYQEDAIASADGHTRAFDAEARGTVFGSGCGVVVLKRLKDALADGDHIYAVIRGAAVNNDGHDKVSYVAPSVNGQAEVIALAHALADVSADTIEYVEAHGTGTPLGDPIEVSALSQAFAASTDRKGFCLLGTAKTNLGHLECAAGVTGLIKTALALEHGVIPPSLHFSKPNPRIDFEASPFRVVTELTKWGRGEHPRRAGVSSFGIGGTNAHVVLEEPSAAPADRAQAGRQIIILSARSLRALEDATANLAKFLRDHPDLPLADVAYTLQLGRRELEHRRFVVANSTTEAARLLRRRDCHRVFSSKPKPLAPSAPDELTTLGLHWIAGESIDWTRLHPQSGRRVSLPTYPFQRNRHWIEPRRDAEAGTKQPVAATDLPASVGEPIDPLAALKAELTALSGTDLTTATRETTLLDLGFDSLFLTQIAVNLQKRFGVKLRFRQLLEKLATLGALADFCAKGSGTAKSAPVPAPALPRIEVREPIPAPKPVPFGPFRPAQTDATASFTASQQAHLEGLIERYVQKTPESKRRTQASRRHFADPRSVAGFRPYWKEMVYPIITERSAGARLWDVDGNEYIDVTMGFGTNLLGHAPAFINAALEEQLKKGIEVGPQSPLAGEVSQLLCELTGHERAAFCNTGSEAVLAAIRIARTVTGRARFAITTGAYHGICDEVLVRPSVVNGVRRTVPIAPGVPDHIAREVLVLDYGTEESLQLLREHGHELAALMVEPVQSRHPDLQPREFLHEARRITAETGTALILDEVINGFRCHLNGAQAYFGVKSDIGTWGKIIGGGMPIGAVTGSAEYMDALDGGFWQFGDDSFPEAGVTFFAGTYVRHPLALAASRAMLRYLKQEGPGLQQRLNERTAELVAHLNGWLREHETPLHLEHFSSHFYLHFAPEIRHGSLLYFHLREKGLHIWEGRPCFLSTAHTDADVAEIIRIFKEGVLEMQCGGFLPGRAIEREACACTAELKASSGKRVATSPWQRGLWAIGQLGGQAGRAYNEAITLDLRGPLNLQALRTAMQQLVDRHEAFRTTVEPDGESLVIHRQLPFEVAFEDFAALDAVARENRRAASFAAFEQTEFDCGVAPILKVLVVKLAADHHQVAVLFHHILGNGPAYWIFMEELVALYDAAVRGTTAGLEAPLQLSDHLRWQERRLRSEEYKADEAFWLSHLGGDLPKLDLPTDRPRPAVRRFQGGRAVAQLDSALTRRLRETGAKHGSSLFMLLFAACNAWLSRLSGQNDIVVGIPSESSIREVPGGPRLFANTTNMLPLRSRMQADMRFDELLAQTKSLVLSGSEHQEYFFGHLLPKLALPFDASRPAIFSVTFNYESGKFAQEGGGVQFELISEGVPYRNARDIAQFDLVINIAEKDGALTMECDFDADLFEAATIDRWLGHYRTLLDAIITAPGERLASLPLLTAAEAGQFAAWNRTERPYPADESIFTLFDRQAHANPSATAMIDGERSVSYAELHRLANRYAAELPAIGSGDLVGVPAVRRIEFVAAVLGILKMGGAYVPLSPDDPPERRAMLAADCKAVLDLDREPNSSPDAAPKAPTVGGGDAAYVLFTSGSTGTPKGVVVPHRAISRLVINSDYVAFRPDEVVAMASNLCFDAATFEIWGALLNGGTLVVTPQDALLTPAALSEHLATHRITTLFLTTSLFHQMAQQAPAIFKGLRNLVFGGEAADAHAVRLVLEHGKPERLVNGYGPTETTTFAVCHVCETAGKKVPIGRPISNTTAHILDASLRPVPIGVVGELHIGGPGVALGYHRSPELTADRFIETEHGRLYRTGDLARWLPDGTIEYLGRRDQQLKIRGFRVEPGEVEAALRQVAGVGPCAVVPRDGANGRQLVAYFAPNGVEPPAADAMRAQLSRTLPAWMMPAAFVPVDRLPLTPNGKLDIRALPLPSAPSRRAPQHIESTLQAQLIELWQEVLEIAGVGLEDDFFELGGHSLLAARMLSLLENRLGPRVPFSVLFERPTISHLAEYLVNERRRASVDSPLVCVQAQGAKTPFFFLHGDFSGGGFYCRSLAKHIGPDRPFYAIHPHGLHGELPPASIEAMAAERLGNIRAVQPHGPYLLGGFCNGAIVAFEMARQLEAVGERVGTVILFGADGSNFRYRHVARMAHQWSAVLGENRDDRAARFLVWREKARNVEDWGRAQLLRIRAASRDIGHVPRRAMELLRNWSQTAETSLSAGPVCDAISQATARVEAAYVAALDAYVPGPLSTRAVLLWPEEDPAPEGENPAYGWQSVCSEVRSIIVPGEHHSSIAIDGNLRVVAEHVRQALNETD